MDYAAFYLSFVASFCLVFAVACADDEAAGGTGGGGGTAGTAGTGGTGGVIPEFEVGCNAVANDFGLLVRLLATSGELSADAPFDVDFTGTVVLPLA